MATYNEGPGKDKNGKDLTPLPSQPNTNEGLDPTSTGQNRVFWSDRFVEPKQQHRFTIKIPIYTPNGAKKDSLLMAQAIKARLKKNTPSEDSIKTIFDKIADKQVGADLRAVGEAPAQIISVNDVTLDSSKTFLDLSSVVDHIRSKYTIKVGFDTAPGEEEYLKALGIHTEVTNLFKDKKNSSIFNSDTFSTSDKNNLGSNDDLGLYMRVSEYVGYSFTPPGFNYTPGDIGLDGEGNTIRIEGLGNYGRSAATLTFVTTLRDDLHFSLNLLWALSTNSSGGSRKSSVRLFDPFLTGELTDNQKVVTIYEHYARQTKDGNGESINGINKYDIAGIHKIYDPYIESVTFGEFSYGGSELIKITMNLTYGGKYDQSNFYSYQTTEDRYGKGKVYAMDQGSYKTTNPYHDKIYGPEGPRPTDPSVVRNKYSKDYKEVIKNRRTPSTEEDPDGKSVAEIEKRRKALREIMEGDNINRKNDLVTKGISTIIEERERAAAAQQQQLDELYAPGGALAKEAEEFQRQRRAALFARTNRPKEDFDQDAFNRKVRRERRRSRRSE